MISSKQNKIENSDEGINKNDYFKLIRFITISGNFELFFLLKVSI